MTPTEALVLAHFSDEMTDEQAREYVELHAEDIEEAIHSLMEQGTLTEDFEVAA
jgi:hypothetical protein